MPYGDKHIPEGRLKEMLQELQEHFGEPVRPVSEYCDAFYKWSQAIGELLKDPEVTEHDRQYWTPVSVALGRISIPVAKSNYLFRRIYGDGLHRTEKCPRHKGQWSGYAWDDICEYGCQHGYDQTGWLPETHEYVEPPEDVLPLYKDGQIVRMGVEYAQGRCYKCGGTKEKGKHED